MLDIHFIGLFPSTSLQKGIDANQARTCNCTC